jgi:hypothetical protein
MIERRKVKEKQHTLLELEFDLPLGLKTDFEGERAFSFIFKDLKK